MAAACANNILALEANGMALAATLGCGQTFSWEMRADGWYEGVAGRRAVLARQEGARLLLAQPNAAAFTAEDARYWQRYFALDLDYGAIQEKLCRHSALARCVAAQPGIRVLRQPFFDTLLSFILSQNNNIPRITKNVRLLRQLLGAELFPGIYAFPTPKALAAQNEAALAPLRAGYRARYLLDAARQAEGGLGGQVLNDMSDGDARQALCGILGVGRKVADCVLLFGLGRFGAAPVDTWIKKALPALFGANGWPPCAAGLEGIAQQYVFAWARSTVDFDAGSVYTEKQGQTAGGRGQP